MQRFTKSERLCSSKLIDRLFAEGNRSIGSFPVRLVWLEMPGSELQGIRVLVSVSKRHFKHAVDRNRAKRQIREFYRTGCSALKQAVSMRGGGLLLAFVYTGDRLMPSDELISRLEQAANRLLKRLEDNGNQ